ncbi:hypothetical protein RE474_00170 [Methanolobus sediminis]|uniref:Right handed beta helix region n=1 Tax=Methanolobus sediminis TaxID=3072978 RepID=A0AA51YM34_9EURY|nr:hypothetical protein [Methanolobus sediminis]WMW25168.1 hypothetical protein RE474_00170 [Methanolobus sediminis]
MKKLKIYAIMFSLALLVFASGCVSTQEDQTSSDSNTSDVQVDESSTDMGNMTPPDGMDGGEMGTAPGGGSSSSVDTGTGAYVLVDGEELNGGTYTSSNDDENAIRAENDTTATLNDVTVEKTDGSASSSDASSFYGLNSAILALDNAVLYINGGSVTATTEGSNGVFAYDGATIYIEDTDVTVSGGNAGGIEVAGGGTMYATNLNVLSTVKAAIRSDRGGGTMIVDGGTYTTSGSSGAPAIYCTADVTVSNATLTAENSEAVVVEGLNSVTINNCDVTGNMDGVYGDDSSENIQNVMLYQSMSGDAEVGTSSFTMTGGSLVSNNGDMFYVTNTESVITLNNVDLTLADDTYLILIAGNDGSRGWGTEGSNGGVCEVDFNDQTATGDIMVDSISEMTLSISDGSTYTGAINSDGTAASVLSVTIDDTSAWTLTGDSYVTELSGTTDNIDLNGYTLYVDGVAFE